MAKTESGLVSGSAMEFSATSSEDESAKRMKASTENGGLFGWLDRKEAPPESEASEEPLSPEEILHQYEELARETRMKLIRETLCRTEELLENGTCPDCGCLIQKPKRNVDEEESDAESVHNDADVAKIASLEEQKLKQKNEIDKLRADVRIKNGELKEMEDQIVQQKNEIARLQNECDKKDIQLVELGTSHLQVSDHHDFLVKSLYNCLEVSGNEKHFKKLCDMDKDLQSAKDLDLMQRTQGEFLVFLGLPPEIGERLEDAKAASWANLEKALLEELANCFPKVPQAGLQFKVEVRAVDHFLPAPASRDGVVANSLADFNRRCERFFSVGKEFHAVSMSLNPAEQSSSGEQQDESEDISNEKGVSLGVLFTLKVPDAMSSVHLEPPEPPVDLSALNMEEGGSEEVAAVPASQQIPVGLPEGFYPGKEVVGKLSSSTSLWARFAPVLVKNTKDIPLLPLTPDGSPDDQANNALLLPAHLVDEDVFAQCGQMKFVSAQETTSRGNRATAQVQPRLSGPTRLLKASMGGRETNPFAMLDPLLQPEAPNRPTIPQRERGILLVPDEFSKAFKAYTTSVVNRAGFDEFLRYRVLANRLTFDALVREFSALTHRVPEACALAGKEKQIMESQMYSLLKALRELEAEHLYLQQQYDELEVFAAGLRDELDQTKAQLAAMMEQNAQLQEENASLQAQLAKIEAEAGEALTRIKQLEELLRAAEQEKAELLLAIEELRSRIEQLEREGPSREVQQAMAQHGLRSQDLSHTLGGSSDDDGSGSPKRRKKKVRDRSVFDRLYQDARNRLIRLQELQRQFKLAMEEQRLKILKCVEGHTSLFPDFLFIDEDLSDVDNLTSFVLEHCGASAVRDGRQAHWMAQTGGRPWSSPARQQEGMNADHGNYNRTSSAGTKNGSAKNRTSMGGSTRPGSAAGTWSSRPMSRASSSSGAPTSAGGQALSRASSPPSRMATKNRVSGTLTVSNRYENARNSRKRFLYEDISAMTNSNSKLLKEELKPLIPVTPRAATTNNMQGMLAAVPNAERHQSSRNASASTASAFDPRNSGTVGGDASSTSEQTTATAEAKNRSRSTRNSASVAVYQPHLPVTAEQEEMEVDVGREGADHTASSPARPGSANIARSPSSAAAQRLLFYPDRGPELSIHDLVLHAQGIQPKSFRMQTQEENEKKLDNRNEKTSDSRLGQNRSPNRVVSRSNVSSTSPNKTAVTELQLEYPTANGSSSAVMSSTTGQSTENTTSATGSHNRRPSSGGAANLHRRSQLAKQQLQQSGNGGQFGIRISHFDRGGKDNAEMNLLEPPDYETIANPFTPTNEKSVGVEGFQTPKEAVRPWSSSSSSSNLLLHSGGNNYNSAAQGKTGLLMSLRRQDSALRMRNQISTSASGRQQRQNKAMAPCSPNTQDGESITVEPDLQISSLSPQKRPGNSKWQAPNQPRKVYSVPANRSSIPLDRVLGARIHSAPTNAESALPELQPGARRRPHTAGGASSSGGASAQARPPRPK
ncbi:unnamed protein product [Amoebophrya sp. A120]|nr:unnamed protein product [Amoebophrya sp. A120]|eukprot:GSA120T00005193001.1